MHDIENTSLEAHVSLCAERYDALQRRFEHVEQKIDDLAESITVIRDQIVAISERQSERWSTLHIGVIGTLMTVIGFLASLLIQ